MGPFVYIVCNSSYVFQTENSWPIFLKVVALGATWVHKLVSKQKSTNLSFFLNDRNQIHHQRGYMGQFVHITCNALYWYHTGASWPSISKVGEYGAIWVHKLVSKQKLTNLSFYFMIVTKYITKQVTQVNLITLHVSQYMGIRQRSRDHLFRNLSATWVHKLLI